MSNLGVANRSTNPRSIRTFRVTDPYGHHPTSTTLVERLLQAV